MKFFFFHLMPYGHLDLDYDKTHPSASIDLPNSYYDPVKGHGLYHRYLDELVLADRLGYDGVCVNEHHQNGYGLMPSPNLIAASLARRTSRAAICVIGNSIAGYNPPIRVAEEFAMLDVISGGRLIAGFPVGTSMDMNFAYGIDPATLRDRYYEAHDLVIQAWTRPEVFAFNGKYTQVRYVNIWPLPLQKPHPRGFLTIQDEFDLPAREFVYVADNPGKDFVGPRSLGWKTVRVRRPEGQYAHLSVEPAQDADSTVTSLTSRNSARRCSRVSPACVLAGSASTTSRSAS